MQERVADGARYIAEPAHWFPGIYDARSRRQLYLDQIFAAEDDAGGRSFMRIVDFRIFAGVFRGRRRLEMVADATAYGLHMGSGVLGYFREIHWSGEGQNGPAALLGDCA